MSVALDLAPATEAEVAEVLADCHARRTPLRLTKTARPAKPCRCRACPAS